MATIILQNKERNLNKISMKEYLKKLNIKTCLYMFLGNFLIGFSVSLLRLSSFGTDPFSCMNIGVSSHLQISYGTYQLLINLILFLPMICWFRRGLGIGTLVNMIGCGYIADFCTWLFDIGNVTSQSLIEFTMLRVLLMFIGILVVCFGVAMYMECDLGVAPYDALGQIVEKLTGGKMKFKWVRVLMDIACVLIGFVFGSVIGIATVITAFMTGPIVVWFRERIVKKWI